MKNVLRQTLLLSLSLLVAVPSLSGFTSKPKPEAQVKTTLTIEMSQEMKTNNSYEFSQPNMDAFEKKYPNITLKTILDPDTQVTSILQTKIAAGSSSDIVNYNKVSAENELDVQDNCVDLSKEAWVKNLSDPSILKAPNGKIYGFTFAKVVGGMGMVYNKDMFKKYGLKIPKTYSELLSVCKAIKAQGVTPIYAPFKDNWTFQIWTTSTWGYYAAKIQPDLWTKLNTHKTKWTAVPAFKDSLQKALDLYKDGYMQASLLSDDYNGTQQAFSSKKYAMMFGIDTFVTDMEAKDKTLNLGIFPFPMFSGESGYLTAGQLGGMYFIPKGGKNITAAKEFLNFIAQPAQVNKAQAMQAFAPNIKGAKAPKFGSFENDVYNTYNKPGKVVTEMNAYVKVDINDLWKYYQNMFAGQMTPAQVLSSWDAKFDSLMKLKGIKGF
jgi:ABC-type sugar transport system, periplasmic component